MTEDEKRQWLLDNWISRNARQAELYLSKGTKRYVEVFEQSEYARQLSRGRVFRIVFRREMVINYEKVSVVTKIDCTNQVNWLIFRQSINKKWNPKILSGK